MLDMSHQTPEEFKKHREAGQAALDSHDHQGLKRFLRLDTAAYEDGPLPGKTKELLGLIASMVLRCNDCIDYHLGQCVKAGYSREEIMDAMNVALVVGGSIVIPHLRHAALSLEDLLKDSN